MITPPPSRVKLLLSAAFTTVFPYTRHRISGLASLRRSIALCPNCKDDPAPDASPYDPDVDQAGRELAKRLYEELLTSQTAAREAALYHLEDLVLGERGHLVTVKLGQSPYTQTCSICGKTIAEEFGLRLELRDCWRNTMTVVGLCEQHSVEGFWAGDIDIHKNNEWPWLGPC